MKWMKKVLLVKALRIDRNDEHNDLLRTTGCERVHTSKLCTNSIRRLVQLAHDMGAATSEIVRGRD